MAMTLEVSLPSGQSVKLQLPGEGTVQELKVAAQVALGRKFLTLSKADGTLDPCEIYEIYVPKMFFSRVSNWSNRRYPERRELGVDGGHGFGHLCCDALSGLSAFSFNCPRARIRQSHAFLLREFVNVRRRFCNAVGLSDVLKRKIE